MLFSTPVSTLKNRLRPTLALGLLSLTCLIAAPANVAVGQDLTIGSEAPALDIEHWVSDRDGDFSQITEFESGKVYVVEFWATWCGPCISSMPHLAKLQDQYADKGVQLISVSSEKLETVEKFLGRNVRPARGSKPDPDAEPMTYGELTSGYCLTTDPDRSVNADYMKAAKRTGIPCAFIVGKTGLIEWIGHPIRIDEPLEGVVEGSWDSEAFAVEYAYIANRDATIREVQKLASKGDAEVAIAKLDELLETIPAGHEDESRLKPLRQSLSLGVEGETSVNAMNEIAESDDDMQIVQSISMIAAQAKRGREIDDDLADATLKAANVALARSKRVQVMGTFSKAKLLYELGRFEEALATQKELLKISDNQVTRKLLEQIEQSIADEAAEEAKATAESDEKDPVKDEAAEKAPMKDEAVEKAPMKDEAVEKAPMKEDSDE